MRRRSSAVFWTAGVVLCLTALSLDIAAAPRPAQTGPSTVRVERHGEGYRLLVNGQPFYVRGAGLEHGDVAALAARGGNAFRTWRVDTQRESGADVLDRAQQQGLFVAMGLDVARERHGFDYDDERGVARQLAGLRQQVLRYKDHPALLLWVVGNELNLEATNPRVWNAVNDIVEMIREVDPRHPALTPLAGFDAATLAEIRRRAPALELLGVQLYGGIARLGQLREVGWDGPYLVTEWGPTGHWEVPQTPWGAPIEESSQQKAEQLVRRYREHILADAERCLGSFVFLWGQKQERTPTWYGMFLSSGESTAAADAMQRLWTGSSPEHPAPSVGELRLDGRRAEDAVVVSPREQLQARVELDEMDAATLDFEWLVREESQVTSVGGDPEVLPAKARVRILPGAPGAAGFRAPLRPGAYRLFVTVRDQHGAAGHSNLPFLVAKP